jgi:hypothetical protein
MNVQCSYEWCDKPAIAKSLCRPHYSVLHRKKNKTPYVDASKKWRAKNSGVVRDKMLRCRYGITTADFDAMLARQCGKCAICESNKRLCVDHDHVTGRVRGILCHSCNVNLKHHVTAELLRRQADYLERKSA